jgi:hypothetical protein
MNVTNVTNARPVRVLGRLFFSGPFLKGETLELEMPPISLSSLQSNVQTILDVGLDTETVTANTMTANTMTASLYFGDGSAIWNVQAANVVGLSDALQTIDANSVTANFIEATQTLTVGGDASIGGNAVVSGDIVPVTGTAHSLGNATHAFKNLFLDGNASLSTITTTTGNVTVTDMTFDATPLERISTWTEVSIPGTQWIRVRWFPHIQQFVVVADNGNARLLVSEDGTTWVPKIIDPIDTYSDIGYGAGLFVAVAYGGSIVTSPDLVTWTTRTNPGYIWTGIAYSASLGLFAACAVGTGHTQHIATSPDGITWTARTTPDKRFESIIWVDDLGIFVTVSQDGSPVLTSSDGTTWTENAISSTAIWRDLVWSPTLGRLVAVSINSGQAMYSSDGVSWTVVNVPRNNWVRVEWTDLGYFVACAYSGVKNRVMISSDGIAWTPLHIDNDVMYHGVAWSPTLQRCVIVSYGEGIGLVSAAPPRVSGSGGVVGSGGSTQRPALDFGDRTGVYQPGANSVGVSSKGLECWRTEYVKAGDVWTLQNTPADNDWRSVLWVSDLGLFVAVGRTGTGNRVMTSPDGKTWTVRTSAADNQWYGIAWSPDLGLLAAVARNGSGDQVMTSPDGITWTIQTTPQDDQWLGIAWGAGRFVACSLEGTVMTSVDGVTWTLTTTPGGEYFDVAWSEEQGQFVAVGTNTVITSPNGLSWTARTPADATNLWKSVAYSPSLDLWVAVSQGTGVGNRVMTSPDGITWTSRTSPADNAWYDVIWVDELDLFISCAYSGTDRIMVSPDGVTWTLKTPPAYEWLGLAWSPELHILVAVDYNTGVGQRVMTSESLGKAIVTNDMTVNGLTVGRGGTGENSTSNTAFGDQALLQNLSGYQNVAVGQNALLQCSTGFRNVAIGSLSLFGNNGYHNTSVGFRSMYLNTTGSFNSAVGYEALRFTTTSAEANFTNTSGLGYRSRCSGDNQVQLGDSSTTTYAYGAVQNRSDIRDKTAVRDETLGLQFICALRPVQFRWNYREKYFDTVLTVEVDSTDLPPGEYDLLVDQATIGTLVVDESHTCTVTNGATWQDEKEVPTEATVDGTVITLRPVSTLVAVPNDGSRSGSRYHHGLIAQEVKQVVDDLELGDFAGLQHHAHNGGEDVYSLGYEQLIAPLIKSVQQLKAQNDAKDVQLEEIQATVVQQEETISSLQAMVQAMEARLSALESA